MASEAASKVVEMLSPEGGKKFSFPEMEEKILALWGEANLDAFATSLKLSEGRPIYTFYDGPPFATGLPHYGHILAGTIKDTVTRYAHQTGHYVSRRFGWDCHGLPVEHEIDKKLGITGAQDVADMGIAAYNAECRAIVTRYTSEWESVVTRLGRWIDFKNDYKTMEPWYMESVWWVFSELFKKGLVYSSYKVMPYSTACTTPLSNFEAKLAYKDVDDPAVVVSFPIVDDAEGTKLLAWTTTPWTLPSNLALCVHAQMHYVKIKKTSTGEIWIMAEARLGQLFPPCATFLAAKNRAEEEAAAAAAKAAGKTVEKKEEKADEGGYKSVVARTFNIIFTDEVLAGLEGLDFSILSRCRGSDLVDTKYVPLFPYFVERCPNAFRVISDEYVTDNGGTGIVHQAPAFGEDDFRVCVANAIVGDPSEGELELPCPVDADGRFTDEVPDFVGQHVKEADSNICRHLKDAKRLVQKQTYHHSYPFCWRSDTPLIYRAIPSWFVKVTAIKERLIANNKTTHWVPKHVKEGRFHNWLVEAHDWAISRNRYWGTPLPIWISDDGEEIVVPSSIAELEELTGQAPGSITDIHRESIDDLTIPSKQGKGILKRVPEVFDCWFESGSMPYAQSHYPFNKDTKEQFEDNFPADFIAEGLDQTRGWFYTLMVISTALFDKPPFKNLICNGLVLAEDGKKMSKRLKNYPDPSIVTNKYGADALRLYLINSPVVRAEPFAFAEIGVKRVVQTVMLPWLNTLNLFDQSVQRLMAKTGVPFTPDRSRVASSSNAMDRWVMATLQDLIATVRREMGAYNLYNVVPPLVDFIGSLTNWYLRLNRFRLKGKGEGGVEEQITVLCTLYEVLLDLSVLMGPATPFFAEFVYQTLRLYHPLCPAAGVSAADASAADGVPIDALGRSESVHYVMIPDSDAALTDAAIVDAVTLLQSAIELGRGIRSRPTVNISVKQPLRSIVIVHADPAKLELLRDLEPYIASELNILDPIRFDSDESAYCRPSLELNFGRMGKILRGDMGAVQTALAALSKEEARAVTESGEVTLAGHTLKISDQDLIVTQVYDGSAAGAVASTASRWEAATEIGGGLTLLLNVALDAGLEAMGVAREIASAVQQLRKSSGLQLTDSIEAHYSVAADSPRAAEIIAAVAANQGLIAETIGQPVIAFAAKAAMSVVLGTETVMVGKKVEVAVAGAKGGDGKKGKKGKAKLSKAERKAAAKAKKAAKAAGAAAPPPAPAAAAAAAAAPAPATKGKKEEGKKGKKSSGGKQKKGAKPAKAAPSAAEGVAVTITLVRPCVSFVADVAMKRMLRASKVQIQCIKSMLTGRDHAALTSQLEASAGGVFKCSFREDKDAALKTFELVRGKHFFLSALERAQSK